RGGETLVGDKGYAGRAFAADAADLGVLVVRPKRADEVGEGPHLAPIRQRIESIFWTLKDLLTLERHGARTLAGLRERLLQRFLCLAACISLNHRLGRPSRALVDYCA
ncbi:MAG TPA: transposase, partial [Thermoleophilia bacterium]|nr:transposase [Thermoleophilia bacterium]